MDARRIVPLIVVGAMLIAAGPAQARPAPGRSSNEPLQARSAFCVPCAIVAARLVVAAAAVVRTPPVIRTLAIVGHTLTPRARGVRITARRLLDLRVQATLVARNGARWTQRRWPRLKPYVRACLAGVAGLATTRILHDGKVTLDEWKHYLLIADPGNPNPDVLNLYFNPALDFSVPRDGWTAACAVGVVTRGATG